MTRTIFIGEITNEQQRIYDLVLNNQQKVLNEIYDGANIKTIVKSVESDFSLNNETLVHSLGHGVGLDIHELPVITHKNDTNLKENMIITNEPGIYIPGNFGVRIEDTVLVTNGKAEPLTRSPKNLIEL